MRGIVELGKTIESVPSVLDSSIEDKIDTNKMAEGKCTGRVDCWLEKGGGRLDC